MLNYQTFIAGMTKELHLYLQENDTGDVNPAILWDAAKAVLRGSVIAKTSLLKKLKNKKLFDLQEQLRNLEQRHSVSKDPETSQKMKPIRQDIDKILSEEVERSIRYMKQRYYESGQKATKLLSWRLGKQQAERTIYKIKDPDTNKITSTPEGIQRAFERYESLYTQVDKTDKHTIENFLNSLDLPSLGAKQNQVLTSKVRVEEIDKAISNLYNNKSPGTDGFPPEWYKAMRNKVLPLLDTCFNYVLKEGASPPSWREAFISVISKEGKDKTDCLGYRPISVLNTDCKLYASILSKRLEVMPQLIDEDQTGFLKDRQTLDNIRRALHTIHQIQKEEISSVLSLDAEKAFDSVGWDFLFSVTVCPDLDLVRISYGPYKHSICPQQQE